MATDLVTLGFAFNYSNAETEINKLVNSFEKLSETTKKTKADMAAIGKDDFSADIKEKIRTLKENISSLGTVANKTSASLQKVPNIFKKLDSIDIKPVRKDTIASVKELTKVIIKAKTEINNVGSMADWTNGIKTKIRELNLTLLSLSSMATKTSVSIRKIPKIFERLDAMKLKPISVETIKSFRDFATAIRSVVNALDRLDIATRKVKKPESIILVRQELERTNEEANSLAGTFVDFIKTRALFNFLSESTNKAVEFGEQLAHIASLTISFDTSKLREGFLNLSSEFGNASMLAEATYYAYSSGVRGTESDLIKFTQDMSKLATVIRAGVTPTVDAVTSAMNSYRLTVKDSAELTDLFYGIVKQGKAKGEQLASGIGQVISTAATAGVTLDELGASVASLTKVMQTRNAITYFNNMLSKMIKPTKETRLAAQKLGIELGLSSLKAKGFSGMMEEIREKTKGSQQAILSIFPDLRGQRAALHLLNNGWSDFQSQLTYFSHKSGVAGKAFEKLSEDANFQFSKLPETMNKLMLSTGDMITQIITFGGALTPLVRGLNNMSASTQKAVSATLLLVSGYVALRSAMRIVKALSDKGLFKDFIIAQGLFSTAGIKKTGFVAGLSAGFFDTATRNAFAQTRNTFKTLIHPLNSVTKAFSAMNRGRMLSSLATSLTSVGVAFGRIGKKLLGIFSAANVIIAGSIGVVVGAIDLIQSKVRTGKWYGDTKVLAPLVDWFMGVEEERQRYAEAQKHIDAYYEVLTEQKGFSKLRNAIGEFMDSFDEDLMSSSATFKDKMTGTMESLYGELKNLGSTEFDKLIEAMWKREEFAKEYAKAEREAAEIQKKQDLDPYQQRHLENLKNHYEEAKQTVAKIEENISETSARVKNYVGDLRTLVSNQKKALESIMTLQNQAKYNMLDDSGKYKFNSEKFKVSIKEYFSQFKTGDTALAAEKFKDVISSYSFMISSISGEITKFNSLIGKYKDDIFEARVNQLIDDTGKFVEYYSDKEKRIIREWQSDYRGDDETDFLGYRKHDKKLTTEQKKALAYQKKANDIYASSALNVLNDKSLRKNLSSKELENAYALAKKAIEYEKKSMELNRDSAQKEYDAKKKLADAQREYNNTTMQIVNTLNKLNPNTADFLSAYSQEAIKLANMEFANYNFGKMFAEENDVNPESVYDSINKKSLEIAKTEQKFAETVKQISQERERSLTIEKENLDRTIESVFKANDNYYGRITAQVEDIREMISILATKTINWKDGELMQTMNERLKDIAITFNNFGTTEIN